MGVRDSVYTGAISQGCLRSRLDSMKEDQTKTWMERLVQALGGGPQTRSDIVDILRDAGQREVIDTYSLAMIEGVFHVSEDQVRDIMISRSQMVVVEQDADFNTILEVVTPSGHSRFPVIGDNRDEVVGILLAKDLLQYVDQVSAFDLNDVLRPAVFIPESKRLNVLLQEFRSGRNHMAIVVDEYGGVAGIVTIEDVLEQIVGEIGDEHDAEEDLSIRQLGEHRYVMQGLTEIDSFNRFFGTGLDTQEFDTVGGLVMRQLGHLPKPGESCQVDDIVLTVKAADSRRIHRLEATTADH